MCTREDVGMLTAVLPSGKLSQPRLWSANVTGPLLMRADHAADSEVGTLVRGLANLQARSGDGWMQSPGAIA